MGNSERVNNFRMYDVTIQYSKSGLGIRSDDFVVEGNTFEIVAGSGTRRGILHYGNGGDSFIADNTFINNAGATLRAINLSSTSGSNTGDDLAGSLTIEDSSFTGDLSQFVNMDNFQGDPGAFELIANGNVTPETNAFIVTFGVAENYGDVFSQVVLIDNTLTNDHHATGGKGVFGMDGFGPVSFRSSDLPIISSGNVLGQLTFRTGWAEADGSTGSIAGYSTGNIDPEPTVTLSAGSDPAVRYLDTSTNTITSPAGLSGSGNVGNDPQQIVITPDGTRAYYSANGSSEVRMISLATDTVDATISVGASPRAIAVSPDGNTIYVVSDTGVQVIDSDTGSGTFNTVTGTIAVGGDGRGVVFSPDGTKAYLTSQGVDGTVSTINTATNTVIGTINLGAGENPAAVAITPNGSTLYVANDPGNTVWVIPV